MTKLMLAGAALVVAWLGLDCLDFDGRRLWEKKLPLTKSFAGNATPGIAGGVIYVRTHSALYAFAEAYE